jgi:hypothetical protein
MPGRGKLFLFSQKSPDQLWGAHRACYSAGDGVLPRGQSGRGVKLTIHLYLALRLRMSGAILVFPLYAFGQPQH